MDSVFGLVGDRFVLLAADASAARSILVFKQDQDKIMELDDHKLIAGSGVAADSSNFMEYIQKNLKLYELNNDVKLDCPSAANFIRGELARALRRGPYQTNLLLAGFDSPNEVSLYYMDYLAAMTKVNYGAHGYASNFILSIFDRDWRPNLSIEEGIAILRKCVAELHTRFLISQPKFIVKVVDENGVRNVTI